MRGVSGEKEKKDPYLPPSWRHSIPGAIGWLLAAGAASKKIFACVFGDRISLLSFQKLGDSAPRRRGREGGEGGDAHTAKVGRCMQVRGGREREKK